MRAAGTDAEFDAYMAARQSSLLRTAYLLTGDRGAAVALVQVTLARLYLCWDRVDRREPVDRYVRRVMLQGYSSPWRRGRRRRRVAAAGVPGPDPVSDLIEPDEPGEAVWRLVQALPRRQRAVAVLRFHDGLDEAEVAEILGTSVESVRARSERVLGAMPARVRRRPMVPAEEGDDR